MVVEGDGGNKDRVKRAVEGKGKFAGCGPPAAKLRFFAVLPPAPTLDGFSVFLGVNHEHVTRQPRNPFKMDNTRAKRP